MASFRERYGDLGVAMIVVVALLLASGCIALLQYGLDVPNPSAVYLVAVIVAAVVGGTRWAVIAAVASFLLYDILFVEPIMTLTVANPAEWLHLLLLLFVGIVVGRLVAVMQTRADTAIAREREARALFQVSRLLATRSSTIDVLPDIAAILRTEAGMTRVWIGLATADGLEHIVADTAGGPRPVGRGVSLVLRRMPGDVPAEWVRIHDPGQVGRQRSSQRDRSAGESPMTGIQHRVRIDAGEHMLGSVWALRDADRDKPSQTETRLLAAAADQVGQALRQDQLAAEARDVEIARRSDALKSALLESVSHDLRTPLASIRAAAGSLLDQDIELSTADRRESAEAIDREAEHLGRLVSNLLDLSRIEGGALRAEREPFELEDLVATAVQRVRPRLAGRSIVLGVPADLPPVMVDPVFVDEILGNLLENAVKYVPPEAPIRIIAHSIVPDGPEVGGMVRLTVEDGGRGVPDDTLSHLFEKFYRVRRTGERSRPGTGIGLAVVRGLTDAMGATVVARRSALGGLAVDLDLPVAAAPVPAATRPEP